MAWKRASAASPARKPMFSWSDGAHLDRVDGGTTHSSSSLDYFAPNHHLEIVHVWLLEGESDDQVLVDLLCADRSWTSEAWSRHVASLIELLRAALDVRVDLMATTEIQDWAPVQRALDQAPRNPLEPPTIADPEVEAYLLLGVVPPGLLGEYF